MNILEKARSLPHGVAAITEWLGSGGDVVEPAVAQHRANICIGCPNNEAGDKLTGVVADGVRNLLSWKNKVGLKVFGEHRLGNCDVCGCVLKLQIWEPTEDVKASMTEHEKAKLPSHCWKLE